MIYGVLNIECEFTNVISCVCVSGKEAALNLALYLSDTSLKCRSCILKILIS